MTQNSFSWLNGKIIPSEEAVVPIMTHSLQYGSGMFEGIRGYKTDSGTAIFRLEDHVTRFFNTAKIYRMDLGFTTEEISSAIVDLVSRNNLEDCYIRPFAFYDDSTVGVGTTGKKISVFIGAFPFKRYFSGGSEGLKCKVSSWTRISSSELPIQAKGSGNYLNSTMAMKDAHASGFDEAIFLSRDGYVMEGPGENIFLVKDGHMITPGVDSSILLGITRYTIIDLARDMNLAVEERFVHREELYTADELFFCGSAAEVTPIVNVDGITVGDGHPGIVTTKMKDLYFSTVQGNNVKHESWLTRVK